VDRGERHFASDARYDLQNVTAGFASRLEDQSADAALMERICRYYIKAMEREQCAPKAYRATGWWEQQRRGNLEPIIQVLTTGDIAAVRGMYRNFYRDPCSAGLIALQSLSKDYFGETIKDFHRRLYLIDSLYRVDYWKARTGGRFTLNDLSGPPIGNPFGVLMDGVLVRARAEYQHYCADRINGLLGSRKGIVVEIGGGFGGTAYYLLRDRPGLKYIDFDVPESIALTAYYLLKAFPHLRFLLYGEEELTAEAISRADVVLMPVSELPGMPPARADITFSSHAMSDLSSEAMTEYLNIIAGITSNYFLYIGNGSGGKAISDLVERQYRSLKLVETRTSGWHHHRFPDIKEVESLYRIGGN
jgi:putative sugar O-methyltransferase